MKRQAHLNLPAQLSRYEAWLCLIGGVVLLAPAWQSIHTGEAEVRTYDSGKGGATVRSRGPTVQVMGAVIGSIGLTMVALGGTGLLIKREPNS